MLYIFFLYIHLFIQENHSLLQICEWRKNVNLKDWQQI